ncbi:hypothetical protein P4E94_01890 [Pontiellaceae bacterium B12219]|nr:hypothetical protein [Pontiellaceae bacterium B12219]
MKKSVTISLLAGVICLAGCGKQEQSSESLAVEIPAVFVGVPISGNPVAIPEARTEAQAGDEVILTGLVMGVPHPFVEGRGVFVLGDEETITPCDLNPTDSCAMPWDACCDPADVRLTGTATIQVLGADGKPLRTGLKGVNGLAELSRVTVSGTVAANSTPEAFIVNASAIHIGER